MNRVLNHWHRASITAAGVVLAASGATAETRFLGFETEFDLGAVPTTTTAPAHNSPVFDEASTAEKWEQAIGAYLDGLADRAAMSPVVLDTSRDIETALRALVRAEAEAFAPATLADKRLALEVAHVDAPVALSLEPALLAPTLSHPMGCPACDSESAHATAALAATTEIASASADVEIDDDDAWQKMADWAAARATENEAGRLDDDTAYVEITDESSPAN